MRLAAKLITMTSVVLLSFSATALERYAGLADGSDENLKAVCQDYMVNSFLKNDPELFFHLLPKSMKKMESMLEKDWPEGHLKRFGSEPLTEYELFDINDEVLTSLHKGHSIKRFKFKYKAGTMERYRRSACSFKQGDDQRWYFSQKP
ncbi:MAG: hypothetical protein ACI89T_001695 [Cognaticolwellia sp.]|jgi:hypothetical protein